MPPPESTLAARLANWGRWAQQGLLSGQALSFEGNYRSPQRNMWEAPVSALRPAIDSADAWQVEVAWGSIPYFDRIVLRAHYCYHWTPGHTCRTAAKEAGIRIHVTTLPVALHGARLLLENALGRDEYTNRTILRRMTQKVLAFIRTPLYNSD